MTYAVFDDALHLLRGTGPETRKGGPNHGPMAAEAMLALGRADAVVGWAECYRQKLVEVRPAESAIGKNWAAALGDFARLADWQAFFLQAVSAGRWQSVLRVWLPRLLPGTMATGTHGMIRCGHAVRALEHDITALRLEELSSALAYCAARYARLADPPRLAGRLDLPAAVARLPRLSSDVDRSGPPPLIVRRLHAHAAFQVALAALGRPADIEHALSQMTMNGAQLYLDGAERHPLVLLHAVTGPAAFRLLLPYLSDEDRPQAFAYLWQAFAAWAAAFGAPPAEHHIKARPQSWSDLVDGAVECADDHALKLTEAARREDALAPSPLFHAAAADWLERVRASRSWTSEERVRAGLATRL